MKQARKFNWLNLAGILGLTLAAFLIHGYHPWSEDAETYLPGIEKLLNPHLFPVGAEYFELHAHMTWFHQLLAGTVRLTHLPLAGTILLWQTISLFLFLTACWQLLCRLFPGAQARWAGLALVTALLTMPIAGTSLYLMDPFLNPRNVIAFAQVYAVLKVLQRRYVQAALFLVFSVSIHPFMSAFAGSFCLLLFVLDRWPTRNGTRALAGLRDAAETVSAAGIAVPADSNAGNPFARLLSAPTEAYDQVAATHPYQFLSRWAWYEILGAIAPSVILYWFSRIAETRGWRSLQTLCRALALYGLIYFALGLIVSIPRRFEVLSLVQPMRSLYLLYVLMLLIGGGLLGEYVLRRRAWRWLALFLPLSAGMAYAQRDLYSQSQHIELPGMAPRNPWEQAFLWARDNTPQDAVFAMDPQFMNKDDENGFRAMALRSRLADSVKDSGVVELFPAIADSWRGQVQAQTGIDHFTSDDFARLKRQYNISWVVLSESKIETSADGIICPYRNGVIRVCRIP